MNHPVVATYATRLTLASFLIVSLFACKKDADPVADPESAQAIAGMYQAKTYTDIGEPVSYPINNQTVTLQIKRKAADSVQVDIQATANGKYSPGQNLSYPNATIAKKKFDNGTIIYYVTLNPATPSDCGYNMLWIYAKNGMDYFFIPPGNRPCVGATIRLVKQ